MCGAEEDGVGHSRLDVEMGMSLTGHYSSMSLLLTTSVSLFGGRSLPIVHLMLILVASFLRQAS